ncbi:uncharacterized protein PG986_013680 [Apiospora aurea]|uniref:Uncharacterized protein n=1 Tax=Apiospora aurea TaxID=335848 RepID=A0ABR1PW93_9PEZI
MTGFYDNPLASMGTGLLGSIFGIDVESLLIWGTGLACLSRFCYGVYKKDTLGCVSFRELFLAMSVFWFMGILIVLIAEDLIKDGQRSLPAAAFV